MSGSGGGGGYEYQASAAAYVAVHILVQKKLNWIDHADDVPTVVAEETDGPGDDLKITLQDGTIIELQAKHGLQKDKLWKPILKLAEGLRGEPSLYGILLTDSTASGVIKSDLRTDLKRLGQGRTDGLKAITQELQQKLTEAKIPYDSSLFRRLSICVLDLDNGLANSQAACDSLSQILENQNQFTLAWKILCKEGLNLITNRGRRDAAAWARLLSNESIRFLTERQNPTVIAEIYRNWLRGSPTDLKVLGSGQALSMESDWISLKAKQQQDGEQKEPFKAQFIPDLYPLSIVVGEPGSGKSTLTKYLARYLSGQGKTVLRVRLSSVCKLWSSGGSFEEAMLNDAISNSPLSLDQAKFALSNPNYLLADGLDECGADRANIADQITAWADGHSTTRIIVTTRIGYEPEHFPKWQSLELLPLESSDILKFAKRVLGDSFDETKLETWLESNETISLATKNPLLLGFLLQIFQDFQEYPDPIQNRAKLYEKIINLAYKRPLQDREPVNLEESTAHRILEIAGWELLNNSACSENELRKEVGRKLADDLDIKPFKAEVQAGEGLKFWEQRRIFERVKVGCDESIVFIHRTINEYAAGLYICMLSDENFCQWLTEVYQSSTWKDSLLFAVDLGKEEVIVRHLLKLDNQGIPDSEAVLLAIKILRESINPSFNLLNQAVDRVSKGLESSTCSVVSSTAEILFSLSLKAPDLIDGVSRPYLNHPQLRTRLAATGLSLSCGNECIDTSELEEQIDEIISEVEQIIQINVRDGIKSKNCVFESKNYITYIESNKWVLDLNTLLDDTISLHSWREEFSEQALFQIFKFLLKKKPSLGTAQRIKKIIAQELLNPEIEALLMKLIEENLNARRPGNDREQQAEVYETILRDLPDKIFAQFGNPTLFLKKSSIETEQRISELRFRQNTRSSEQIFLEAILRVVEHDSISSLSELPQEFLLLGVLTKGMRCWEVTGREWDAIEQCQDLESVDVVLKGAIAAMDLDHQRLAVEARQLLEKVCDYGDLGEIEAALSGENSQDRHKAHQKLLEKEFGILSNIPEVPANPKWERVKEIELPIQALKNALDHPSRIIKYNAALILVQKIGEEQAIGIMKSKGLGDE
jgi:hypothetical protein